MIISVFIYGQMCNADKFCMRMTLQLQNYIFPIGTIHFLYVQFFAGGRMCVESMPLTCSAIMFRVPCLRDTVPRMIKTGFLIMKRYRINTFGQTTIEMCPNSSSKVMNVALELLGCCLRTTNPATVTFAPSFRHRILLLYNIAGSRCDLI